MAARGSEPDRREYSDKLIDKGVNTGLPPLSFNGKTTSFFEFWPVWLMYIPVVCYWLCLSLRFRSFGLPMVVNPNIELGGMVGESKHAIFRQGGNKLRKFVLPFIVVQPKPELQDQQAKKLLYKAGQKGIALPCVAKPDMGCRGRGVELIASEQQLGDYIARFDKNRTFLLQQLAPYAAEAGVFYVRYPNEESGKVVSLALKYRPTVVGDGEFTVNELIEQHPRAHKLAKLHCDKNREILNTIPAKGEEVALEFVASHCRGSIFRNGNEFISAELQQVIDELMKDLPNFHYGRLDIKFRDLNALQKGRDFHIVEINGASSEQAHIWDSRTGFWAAMSTLFGQYKMLFTMGNQMRSQGFKVPSAATLIKVWLRELGVKGDYL
ncbi:ATP-grasp domain-containing protein [Teredinibacter haidensis]|uniref:ATP-grasp domain-containing protein n=1 Tax=Teredinibacter haidensis TaxID=2731755 RepID=UPI000948CFE2|nr:ATP-grasp domain-containing protein [Teredinibacter haidensis]